MADEIRYLSLEGLDYFWNYKLKPEIEANEEVVAASLVDLDDRLKSHSHSYVASAGYIATAANAVTAGRAFYSGSAGYAATAARSVTAARAVYSATSGYSGSAGYIATAANAITAGRAFYSGSAGYSASAAKASYAAYAGYVSNSLTIAGISYNGSQAKNITINDLGAASTTHTHTYVASAGYSASAARASYAATADYSGSAGYAATAARSVTAARAVYSASAGYAATAGTVANVKINLAANSVYYPMVFTNVISNNNAASLYIDSSTGTGQSSAGIRYNPSLNACYCSGGFYELSDESKKNFGDDIEVDLDKLSKLSKKYFTWKNDESNTRHIGISAQEIHKLYPEIVNVIDEDGHLSVAYDKLSVVALKGIDVLNDKIKSLEKRLERFEKLIKE